MTCSFFSLSPPQTPCAAHFCSACLAFIHRFYFGYCCCCCGGSVLFVLCASMECEIWCTYVRFVSNTKLLIFSWPNVKDDKDNVNDVGARRNGKHHNHVHTLPHACGTRNDTHKHTHLLRQTANECGGEMVRFRSFGVSCWRRGGVRRNENTPRALRMYLYPRKGYITTNDAAYDVSSFINSRQRLPGHPHSNFCRNQR